MAAFVSSEVSLLRRNRLVLAAMLLPFALLAVFAWAAGTGSDETVPVFLALGLLTFFIGLPASAYMLWINPFKIAVPGEIAVDDEGVRFAGRLFAPRRTIRAGFLIPTWGKPPLVRLVRRWPLAPIELHLQDQSTGRALLCALGLDASQAVASLTFASRARAFAWIAPVGWGILTLIFITLPSLAAAIEVTPGPLLAAAGLLCAALLVAWIVAMAMPTRVIIGVDGVLISWFWRKRFVGYSEVRAVRPFGAGNNQGVALWPASGAPIKLPIKPRFTQGLSDQETDLATQRIQQAIASYHEKRHERDVTLPERGPRTMAEWIRMLRAVGSGGNVDHRTAPVSREELFRIIEDPAATTTARVSAAVAVGGGLDDAGRVRLRIAAEATAAPEVRALLELSAEEAPEAKIAFALSQISGT